MAFEIISRDRWGSKSKWRYGDLVLPVRNVFLHHTVTTVTDFPYQDTRRVEAEGIARYGQMSYSYVVHPSGMILEGAGTKIVLPIVVYIKPVLATASRNSKAVPVKAGKYLYPQS